MAERIPRTMPIPDISSQRFWDGLKAGRLLIQRCTSTGKFQWYPRAHSIHDPAGTLEWVESEGRGKVYSYSIARQTRIDRELPYVYAIIELDEGIRLTANIVNTPIEQIRVGMNVRPVFEKARDGIVILQFEGA